MDSTGLSGVVTISLTGSIITLTATDRRNKSYLLRILLAFSIIGYLSAFSSIKRGPEEKIEDLLLMLNKTFAVVLILLIILKDKFALMYRFLKVESCQVPSKVPVPTTNTTAEIA